jgi:MFS family permease
MTPTAQTSQPTDGRGGDTDAVGHDLEQLDPTGAGSVAGRPERAGLRRLARPLASRSFRRLVGGAFLVGAADWLAVAALVAWAYEHTGSSVGAAAVLLARLAPPLAGGLIAARVVDRYRRERVLVAVASFYAAGLGAVLIALAADSVPLAIAGFAVANALSSLSLATVRPLVPALVPDEQLPSANSVIGAVEDAALGIGALTAGVVVTISGAGVAVAGSAMAAAVAAVLYAGIVAPHAAAPAARPRGGVVAGIRHLMRRRRTAVVVGAFAASIVATGVTNATLPELLNAEIGLGPGGYGFGFAALCSGLVAGQALAGASQGLIGSRAVGVSFVGMGVGLAALAASDSAAAALAALALVGIANGWGEVSMVTVVQREADDAFLGRTFAAAGVIFRTSMIGAVACAPLVGKVADARVVVGAAAVWIAVTGLGALAALREPRATPLAPIPATHR